MSDDLPRYLTLLSHELRAPAGIVRGYLRMLADAQAGTGDREQKAIAQASRATERLVGILEDASALARLLRHETRLERRAVALPVLIHASIQAAELPEDPPSEIDVIAAPELTLDADEARLRAALAAFVSAVARTHAGSGVIEVSAGPVRVAGRPGVRVLVAPRTVSGLKATEAPLDLSRAGLGLQIPLAAAVVAAHGGSARDRRFGERPAGIVVRLPCAPAVY